MNRYLFRTAIVLLMLTFAFTCYAQNQGTEDIIYTGRLLGYSRVPSLQAFNARPGCPETSEADDSEAATDFLGKRNAAAHKKAILVGMGDNFSPQLEARIFEHPKQSPGTYAVGNKELYFSDGTQWHFYRAVPPAVEKVISDGFGTIPTDNVGCFLRAAGFSAIVPGKHDFYFGAERVRELARFLARTNRDYDYEPVQMLGANLVLQTSPIAPKSIPPTLKEKPWFNPEWTSDYEVMNISDGSSVYPWFTYVKIQIAKLPNNEYAREALRDEFDKATSPISLSDLPALVGKARKLSGTALTELEGVEKKAHDFTGSFYICPSTGNPNALPEKVANDCKPLNVASGQVRLVNGTIAYFLKLDPLVTGDKLAAGETIEQGKTIHGDIKHFSTLITGRNYGLCNIISKDQTDCLRFSVHTPFFYFPHRLPQATSSYTDPDPYVYIHDRAAIFGVVEPDLASQVGILNFGWKNLGKGLTTKLSVEDPADALRQQLDYFEVQHKDFKGLKILLAQTSPQRAKVLATRFPEFQIVVSAADLEQATSELTMTTTWNPDGTAGSLVAVPAPYFDSKTRKGWVHFGMIKAEKKSNSWTLSTNSLEPQAIAEKEDPASTFWDEIKKLPNCYSPSKSLSGKTPSNQDYLKLLVLCTMRERLSADVALIQARDLFEKLPLLDDSAAAPAGTRRMLSRPTTPSATAPANAGNFQQMLDRLIWKGDLLTLLYVPGSALKKALELSETFETEENATLSLVVDRGRKLETLGITKDKITGEYLINQLPLEANRIYAVATTDFIGAGDTGYPDLATAALNPKTHPAAFPEKLWSISSLVCRKIFPLSSNANLYCLDSIDSDDYLDETVAAQNPPHRQPSAFDRFIDALPFKGPAAEIVPKTIDAAVEQKAQRRSIWRLSLKDLSVAFSSLNNNFTDEEIAEKFAGNTTPSVQAKHSQDFHFGLDVRFSRSSHRRDFFIEPGIDYKSQTTGDTPEKEQVSQINNRAFAEAGFVLWRTPGRPVPNVGLNLSLHAETQFQRPFSNFTLDNNDPLKIYQPRNIVLLPRLGFRWQNKDDYVEFGGQAGKAFNAFRGFAFDTANGEILCVVSPAQSIDDCITENSKTIGGITKDSPVRVLSEDRPRAGIYWKSNFSIPFGSRVKYIFDDEGDFLFVNFRKDTTLDTRLRDISKHSLSFTIFPSISIGPTLRLLLYQNKINRDFLIQKEFGIETKISFDIFNRRETGVQFRNKP
jgi:hypothetical protein